ncbi:RRXRR domain-containing protein, partial [Vibrio casei]
MLAYVLNKHGKPLMPCKAAKARKLLKNGMAKVIKRAPFTIKLLYGSSGHTQHVVAGMDTGSKYIGCAAIANGKVIYQSEVALRTDVSKKMQQRASMRKKGRLAPSLKSKLDSHLREKKQVEAILPISHWKVETASFDIHKITNPIVTGAGYQQGYYNVKAYV